MKKLFQLLLMCWGCAAWAQQVQFVVPNGLADVEGNSSSADLFRTVSSTFQQVYDASSFPVAPMIRIDGMAFRFDGGSGQTFIGLWGFSVHLSTTPRSPDSLSPHYSDNADMGSVGVAGGYLGIFAPSSSGVRSFSQVEITFETPFFFDPSRGNLSVYTVTSPGPTDLVLDAQLAVGDSVGRVFGDISTTGTVDTLGLVTRFDITLIPEPAIVRLSIIGAFLSLAGRCMRKHQLGWDRQ